MRQRQCEFCLSSSTAAFCQVGDCYAWIPSIADNPPEDVQFQRVQSRCSLPDAHFSGPTRAVSICQCVFGGRSCDSKLSFVVRWMNPFVLIGIHSPISRLDCRRKMFAQYESRLLERDLRIVGVNEYIHFTGPQIMPVNHMLAAKFKGEPCFKLNQCVEVRIFA